MPKLAQGTFAPAMTPPRKKSPLSSSVRRLGADAERDAGKEKVSARAVCTRHLLFTYCLCGKDVLTLRTLVHRMPAVAACSGPQLALHRRDAEPSLPLVDMSLSHSKLSSSAPV